MDKKIMLICTPLRFYTHEDEELFFNWIKKIKCIEKFKGVGVALNLYVTSKDLSDNEVLNLIGLFDRYKFDIKQLEIFKNENNKNWFEK